MLEVNSQNTRRVRGKAQEGSGAIRIVSAICVKSEFPSLDLWRLSLWVVPVLRFS